MFCVDLFPRLCPFTRDQLWLRCAIAGRRYFVSFDMTALMLLHWYFYYDTINGYSLLLHVAGRYLPCHYLSIHYCCLQFPFCLLSCELTLFHGKFYYGFDLIFVYFHRKKKLAKMVLLQKSSVTVIEETRARESLCIHHVFFLF